VLIVTEFLFAMGKLCSNTAAELVDIAEEPFCASLDDLSPISGVKE
jgi:hypothetical protein